MGLMVYADLGYRLCRFVDIGMDLHRLSDPFFVLVDIVFLYFSV